jgi:multisubunit Na+/H+ antiporter MnhB subunit
MTSVILKTATRLVGALVLVLSVYLLWRGHHAPGGGFIAALVAATGFALVALSEGPGVVRRGLRIRPQVLMGVGLGLSMGAGIAGMMHQRPFLTGIWWPSENPVAGTPLLFDLGVFLVVLGAILTVLLALEEN